MAQVMSSMPDVWRRVLAEHVPDERGHCRECRNAQGVSAPWPCVTHGIAEQAKQIHDGQLPDGHLHDRQRHDRQRHDGQRHDGQRHDGGIPEAPVTPGPQRAGRHAAP